MKEAFCESVGLSQANRELLDTINEIIEEYQAQGYKLTLRQLYYQLVSRDIIPNKQESYAKISKILTKGRMAGIVDWSAIEDRVRRPYIPYYCHDPQDAINDTIRQYRLNRQREQTHYVEVWCEKDALSGVLSRITSYYHVRLMVNRGYSSCSAMYDAAQRINRELGDIEDLDGEPEATILYLGDHDPSGLDMIRDVRERLEEFECYVNVKHIALTTEQVNYYNPPPNPAKFSDPRASWYVENFGKTSWEVDALRPDMLNQLIRDSIEEIIDMGKFNRMLEMEQEDKEKLQQFAENM